MNDDLTLITDLGADTLVKVLCDMVNSVLVFSASEMYRLKPVRAESGAFEGSYSFDRLSVAEMDLFRRTLTGDLTEFMNPDRPVLE